MSVWWMKTKPNAGQHWLYSIYVPIVLVWFSMVLLAGLLLPLLSRLVNAS